MINQKDLFILDLLLNFGSINKKRLSNFWITNEEHLYPNEAYDSIAKLMDLNFITVEGQKYNEVVKIVQEKSKEVMDILEGYWRENKIVENLEFIKNNVAENIKLLESEISYKDTILISFLDENDDKKLYMFCKKLVDLKLAFKETDSSSRHQYEHFYLRKIPINIDKEVRNYVKSKININDFKTNLEWRILILPILFDSVNRKDIAAIFPELTRDVVFELIDRLEERGILTTKDENKIEISIPKIFKEFIRKNFEQNGYPAYESWAIDQLKERVLQSILNLYKLGILRKILLNSNAVYDGHFAIIEKGSLKDIDSLKDIKEDDLEEIAKFGLVFLTDNSIVIANKVLEKFEKIIESKLSEEVIRIPANNTHLAHSTFEKIFSNCKEYIKIQDEYVNEKTLEIIESYAPTGINITILTSIEGSRELDIEEMKKIVNRIKSSGRKLRLLFIGKDSGEAPFHFRYIISKDLCYSFSTSIKQVGKSKDTDIIKISKEEKEGKIEPAFDYWVELPKEKLKEKGIQRLEFNEWVSLKANTK